jgi:hypothetical protein
MRQRFRPEVPFVSASTQTFDALIGFTLDGLGIVTLVSNPGGGTDVLTWRPQRRDRDRRLVPKQLLRHLSGVKAVAQHRNGTTYATLDDKGLVRVWDTISSTIGRSHRWR